MVGHKQGFAKDGLAVTPWDQGDQVGGRIGHQILHGLVVFVKCLHTPVPRYLGGRRQSVRPIAIRPRWRSVFGIAAEFQNVPLGNPHMLEETPGCMWKTLGLSALVVMRQIGEGRIEIQMCTTAPQEMQDMVAQDLLGIHAVALHEAPSRRDGERSYSVVMAWPFPSNAAFIVCHGSVAHLTRVG